MSEVVVLYALPIRAGHEDEVIEFARSLDTNPATPAALTEELIAIESVFIDRSCEPARLIVYQRLPDAEHAERALLESTNPVNVEMRRLMSTALESPVVFPLVFDFTGD